MHTHDKLQNTVKRTESPQDLTIPIISGYGRNLQDPTLFAGAVFQEAVNPTLFATKNTYTLAQALTKRTKTGGPMDEPPKSPTWLYREEKTVKDSKPSKIINFQPKPLEISPNIYVQAKNPAGKITIMTTESISKEKPPSQEIPNMAVEGLTVKNRRYAYLDELTESLQDTLTADPLEKHER